MLREVQRDPLLILILSLYLLLLAFFILLNNISEIKDERSRAVAGSLKTTFVTWGDPTRDPKPFTSAFGNVLSDKTLENRLDDLVQSELALARFQIVVPGRMMRLRVDESALFAGRGDRITLAGHQFLAALAAELDNPAPGVRYDVEIRLPRTVPDPHAAYGALRNRIGRVAALSRALADAVARRGAVAGGLDDVGDGEVEFLIEVRPRSEPPLFGGAEDE